MRSLEDVAERSLRGKSCNDSAKLLLTALERELGRMDDEIPKGFRTVGEWSNAWKVAEARARYIIEKRVEEGRMEMQIFKRNRKSRFYRAVK